MTTFVYRVFQEERSIFWEVIISATVRIKSHTNKCLILTGYRDRPVCVLLTYSMEQSPS